MVRTGISKAKSVIILCLTVLHMLFRHVSCEGDDLYRGCPDVPAGWSPQCSRTGHARVQLGKDRMVYWSPFEDGRSWGNALSPYWQARGIAELAGHGFEATTSFNSSWLQYLPQKLAPQACPNSDLWDEICQICEPATQLFTSAVSRS